MSKQYAATDYIDVATRIVEFRDRYPEGSLQPADPTAPYRIETIGGDTYIVVVAAAYRNPSDERPGIGMAYEVYPGKTNFTRGSELQNAETSAWGRAIVAALAADTKRGIASQEEVRNRTAEREDPIAVAKAKVWEQAKRLGLDLAGLRDRYAQDNGGQLLEDAAAGDLHAYAKKLSQIGTNGLPLNKDGSVSKRQTTEEQRAAAGLMTKEQEQAHAALVNEVTGDEKKATRTHGPAEPGPWEDVTVAVPGSAA